MLTEKELENVTVFKDTYNAMYVSGFTTKKLEYVKSISNPIQKRLIENLKYVGTTNYDFIEGPIGVRKFSLTLDGKPKKTIYLFGEYHVETKGHCKPNPYIEFDEYISRLSKESPAFFDIYIELPIVKKSIQGNMNSGTIFHKSVRMMFVKKYMTFRDVYQYFKDQKDLVIVSNAYMINRIETKMKHCVQPESRVNNSKCELMRLHNINIRATWDINPDLKKMYTEDIALNLIRIIFETGLVSAKKDQDIIDVLRRVSQDCPSILNMLKMLIKTETLLDIFLKNKSLKKELKATYKKKELKLWFNSMYYKKIQSFGGKATFIDTIKKLISTIENNTSLSRDIMKKLGFLFINLNSLLVDYYCLARIFKKHDLEGSFQPEESKNIMIYVGDAHARNMTEFFRSIGFKDYFNHYNEQKKSCISLKTPNKNTTVRSPYFFPTPPRKSPSRTIPINAKLNDLRLIAKQRRLKGYSKLNKADLIQFIKKHSISDSNELEELTILQLQTYLKNMGITKYSKLKKADLINLVTNSKLKVFG